MSQFYAFDQMFVQWHTGTRGMPNTKMKRNEEKSLKHYHCKKLR